MSEYAYLKHIPVVIDSGASLSAAIQMAERLLVGIVMPAAWTAANLTFEASVDNDTFDDVYDDLGHEKTVVAAAARHIIIAPTDFAGIEHLKVRSGTSGTPVVQAAERTIYLVVRPA